MAIFSLCPYMVERGKGAFGDLFYKDNNPLWGQQPHDLITFQNPISNLCVYIHVSIYVFLYVYVCVYICIYLLGVRFQHKNFREDIFIQSIAYPHSCVGSKSPYRNIHLIASLLHLWTRVPRTQTTSPWKQDKSKSSTKQTQLKILASMTHREEDHNEVSKKCKDR